MTNTSTPAIAPRHILIGGGSGFIGRALTSVLRARGDRVTLVSRTAGEQRITWEEVKNNGIPDCDVVINLAGKHILDMRRRWTKNYQNEVLESRVVTTALLVKAINAKARPPATFISTAGKCFYGSQAFSSPEQYFDLDESSAPIGIDYPAQLVREWEQAASEIDTTRVRHVKLRLGIVLAGQPTGDGPPVRRAGANGIFPMLRGAFKWGLCVTMGTGVQPFPWVHIKDAVGVFVRAIDQEEMHGVFNIVSPGIVSNEYFTQQLAKKLGRHVLGRIPAAAIKAVVGKDRSTILLLGQRVRPARTIEHGYRFHYPELEAALDDLLCTNSIGGAA